MAACDWSIDVPEELFRGLIYSVATETWRAALRESRELGAKLRGFRPETVPERELDRLVLEALKKTPSVRDLAIERFSTENAGLIAAIDALGPERAASEEEMERLLGGESVSRVFWAAFRGGDAWAPLRDAVLARVRAGRLDGERLFPARLARRPSGPVRPEPFDKPGAGSARGAGGAGGRAESKGRPAADAADLSDRLRRAEREIERARADRDGLRAEVRRLAAAEARLLADRERLEREVEEMRRAAAAAPTASGRQRAVRQDPAERELERLRAELIEERRRSAEATQRARTAERDLADARGRLEYYESRDVRSAYPREPERTSTRLEREKIVWPTAEHHYPARLRPFLERLARSPYVEKIQLREFEDSTETRLKGIDDAGNLHLQYSDGGHAARVYVTTVAKDRNEGRWIAEKILELAPELQS